MPSRPKRKRLLYSKKARYQAANPFENIKAIGEKQKVAYEVWKRDNQIEILSGSIRVGKSFWGGGGWLKWIIDETLAGRVGTYAVLAYNSRLIKTNVFKILEFWAKAYGVEHTVTSEHIILHIGIHDIFIEGYGASNASSFSSFQGSTFKGIFVDEGAIINQHALDVARDRVLTFSVRGESKIIITSNPEGGKQHWFYVDYILNYPTTHFQLLDNPLYDKSILEEYKRIYSEANYKRRILGQWVVGAGAVYEGEPILIDKSDVPDLHDIWVGVDEGRGDAFTAVVTGFNRKLDNYYVIEQKYDKEKKLIDNVFEVKGLLLDIRKQYPNANIKLIGETNPGITYDTLRGDADLFKARINVDKVKKKVRNKEYHGRSSIQERIDVTNMLFFNSKLYIVKDCTNLISAFSNAMYKNGERLDDGSSDIDSLDAFEYSISEELKYIYKSLIKNVELKSLLDKKEEVRASA